MTNLLRTYTLPSLRRRALLRGAASAFDLRGATYRQFRVARTAGAADGDAIRNDFQVVGADLRAALRRYGEAR